MFFKNWQSVALVVVIGSIAYVGLIVFLRASGNRTLSKMNSFDFVITVAFGSTLATILINRNVSLAEGLTAIALLVILQFIITWLAVRSRTVSEVIKTTPTLLVMDGQFLQEAMKTVRVTEDEVRAAARQHGFGEMEQVAAVVLETDGSLSVIGQTQRGSLNVLKGVIGADQ